MVFALPICHAPSPAVGPACLRDAVPSWRVNVGTRENRLIGSSFLAVMIAHVVKGR